MCAYDEMEVMVERLEELKKKAFLLEDELMLQSQLSFEKTGKLSSLVLSEKSVEYENLALDIVKLERMLKAADENKQGIL